MAWKRLSCATRNTGSKDGRGLYLEYPDDAVAGSASWGKGPQARLVETAIPPEVPESSVRILGHCSRDPTRRIRWFTTQSAAATSVRR